MNFYKYVYVIRLIFVYFHRTLAVCNRDLTVVKSGLEVIAQFSVGLQFYADVGNNGNNDYEVELVADQCCLNVENNVDCDILKVAVGCVETIPRGKTKRLKLIVPLLDPLNRRGYCTAFLDSNPTDGKRNVMRNKIKTPFDTRIDNKNQPMEIPDDFSMKPCEIDEDPLNNCDPVDCELYYNGKKSYYNRITKRCVDVPPCISDDGDDIPNIIYNPKKNECIKDDPLPKEDLDFIKGLVHTHERKPKDVVIIKNYRKNPSQTNDLNLISSSVMKKVENDELHKKDTKKHKCDKICKETESKNMKTIIKTKNKTCKSMFNISTNRVTLSVLGVVVIVQCFFICTMVYFLTRSCCCRGKKVVRKYFNYRQDASVTTPLIGTETIDTETTGNQYHSESTNIEKKIKCYKACQKQRNNPKMSLSDDILSKYINRREWQSKPSKSEAIKESTGQPVKDENVIEPNRNKSDKVKQFQTNYAVNVKKPSEVKVNFENERTSKRSDEKKSSKVVKSIVKNIDTKSSPVKKSERTELNDSDIVLSEREIKCHSYNYIDSNLTSNKTNSHEKNHNDRTGFKPSSHSQKIGFYKTEVPKHPGTVSVSTEKSAQACFSNDSMDDFLSERGMLYLAGEDISKYSFSINSNPTKSSVTSEVSSKTSKNNIVKNVLSLLKRRSKGPSSDPGLKKPKESLDLELIHMSKASVCSSSNNCSECINTFKQAKDSRTSM